MAGLRIDFEIEGVKQTAGAIFDVNAKLNDFRKPLTKSNKILLRAIDMQFNSEGGILSPKWKKLSPEYAIWKSRKFGNQKILQATGRMKRSFKSEISKTDLELSNPTPYFKFHQSNKPRRKLPRRLMMAIKRTQNAEIFRAFTEYLNEVAKKF